ncbi:unnamed protein product, partial [marine sediment metagenome]
PGTVWGEPTGIGKEHHPWGHFKPGAWKLVRVITETLDKEGVPTSTSTTKTKTTLLKIEEDGITLGIEVTVEVASKEFKAEPKCVKQGFHGEVVSEDIKIGPPQDAQLTIEGRSIPCQILKIERSDASNKTVTKVYFSDKVCPRIIKRESVTTDPKGETKTSETTVTVVALDMPCKVLAEIKSSALMKTTNKHTKGVVSTWALICRDVPGGIVEFWSKEVDGSGRLLSRSTLELVGYGLEPEEEPTWIGPLGRKRPLRTR